MQLSQSVSIQDLQQGDCALFYFGEIDRWCDVEEVLQGGTERAQLVVMPRGDEHPQAVTVSLSAGTLVSAVRGSANAPGKQMNADLQTSPPA